MGHELLSIFSVSLENFLCAGDIESMPFTEALGQFSYRVGKTALPTKLYTMQFKTLLALTYSNQSTSSNWCSFHRRWQLLFDSRQPCACFKCCW